MVYYAKIFIVLWEKYNAWISSKKIDISANMRLIEKNQNSEFDQNMHGNFQLVNKDNLEESYKCVYQIRFNVVEL